jgi:hypothetical protein
VQLPPQPACPSPPPPDSTSPAPASRIVLSPPLDSDSVVDWESDEEEELVPDSAEASSSQSVPASPPPPAQPRGGGAAGASTSCPRSSGSKAEHSARDPCAADAPSRSSPGRDVS